MDRPRRLRRKLALSLVTLALALGAVEVGARVVLRVRERPYDGEAARRQIAVIRSRVFEILPRSGGPDDGPPDAGARRELHPYVGFDADSSRARLADELAREPQPAEYTVLVLGGSVAAIFHQLGTERLRELLVADPRLGERDLRFLSLARGAYKQPQQLLYLSYALSLGLRPDAVLNIDGFNEAAIGRSNAERGVHPTYPSFDQWMPLVRAPSSSSRWIDAYVEVRTRRDAVVGSADLVCDLPIYGSAALGGAARLLVKRREAQYARAVAEYTRLRDGDALEPALVGAPLDVDVDAAQRVEIACWLESSVLIERLCRAAGVPYLHVLQPTLHDPGAKPISAEEADLGRTSATWKRGVETGYPLLRAGGADLRARGVAFLDASRLFAGIDDTLYYDVCHFGQVGNELLAAAIAPALLEALDRRR